MSGFFGAVCVDIVSKILGKSKKSVSESPMPVGEALQIIQEYGFIMLNKSPAPFYISDVSKLPYPKHRIKEALMMALRVNGKEQMMDALKIGYLQLANWQEGVGEVDMAVGAVESNESATERIKRVTSNHAEVDEWCALIEEERVKLKSDLVSIGVW
jgi:hypothetical protein